jgi:hypothetical protein
MKPCICPSKPGVTGLQPGKTIEKCAHSVREPRQLTTSPKALWIIELFS